MAVDRGGLRYTLAIKDEFSASTAKFVAELGAAKAAFADFRAEVSKGRGAASSIQQMTAAIQKGGQASRKAIAGQSDELKELAAAAKKQRDLERESVRLRNAQNRDLSRERAQQAAGARAQERERRRALVEAERLGAQAQRAELARLKARSDAQRVLERESTRLRAAQTRDQQALIQSQERSRRADPQFKAEQKVNALLERQVVARRQLELLRKGGNEELITRQLRRQAGEIDRSARSANGLLFTFRRLFGVLAAFTIARNLISGFQALLVNGVRFNEQIRQAEIGIAGLITGLADVRNEQGNSVGLAEEFARAQGEARRQVRLLRQDALLTTATFDQLLDTFQVAIGPGFAAGLNLDQIRKLSVSISQAATAIGLPQNQLAEEIRSLVSGTIQARTTRIATVLQITNADIRRLRETGELFDFLENRFRALGLAAEQAARGTLDGIGNLVRDALGAVLGGAAEPLFEELIRLGNEVFDQVLTIRNAAGEIRPNPEAVRAFQAFFDALKEGVVSLRELGRETGFGGLRDLLGTLGSALSVGIQAAVGFAQGLLQVFSAVVTPVRAIANAIGLDVNGSLGDTARLVGRLLAQFLALRAVARLTGFSFKDLKANAAGLLALFRSAGPELRAAFASLGKGGLIGLALVGVAKGFELILEKIFGVNLGLRETVALVGVGLASVLDRAVTKFDVFLVKAAGGLKRLFTFSDEGDAAIEARVKALTDALEAGSAQAQADFDRFISDIVNRARSEQGIIPGLGGEADPAAANRAQAFGEILSNVESIVAKANTALGELDTELFKVGAQFDRAGRSTGLEGLASQVENLFGDASVSSAVRLREVTASLNEVIRNRQRAVDLLGVSEARLRALEQAATAGVENRQAALDRLNPTEEEGRLVSLLRDEALIRERIAEVQAQAFEVAGLQAATLAREALPGLQQENRELAVQLDAERSIADVVTRRLGARRLAVVEAQNELRALQASAQEEQRRLQAQIAALNRRAGPTTGLATPEERAREKERVEAIRSAVRALEEQLATEKGISAEKERQLRAQLELVQLAESGGFGAGAVEGLRQLADDLPTVFEGARNLVVDITNQLRTGLAKAAVEGVREAALEGKNTDFRELFSNLGLSIAESIFQNIIDTALQRLVSVVPTAVDAGADAASQAAKDAAAAAAQATKNAADLVQAQTLAGIELSNATAVATTETTAASSAAFTRTASAQALVAAAAAEVEAATLAASIRAGSSVASGAFRGGLVRGMARGGRVPSVRPTPSPAHARARGMARGGRPRGLNPADTVPMWLQPGEFVIRKSVVDAMGAGFFRSVNAGAFNAPGTGGGASGEAAAAGMVDGGRVTRTEPARSTAGRDQAPVILPAVVTTEREMERLSAGGREAQFRFMRENAQTVRGILGI